MFRHIFPFPMRFCCTGSLGSVTVMGVIQVRGTFRSPLKTRKKSVEPEVRYLTQLLPLPQVILDYCAIKALLTTLSRPKRPGIHVHSFSPSIRP